MRNLRVLALGGLRRARDAAYKILYEGPDAMLQPSIKTCLKWSEEMNRATYGLKPSISVDFSCRLAIGSFATSCTHAIV